MIVVTNYQLLKTFNIIKCNRRQSLMHQKNSNNIEQQYVQKKLLKECNGLKYIFIFRRLKLIFIVLRKHLRIPFYGKFRVGLQNH